jgi:uncharacterized protein with NAD-binding domain and iron-sulfur cluster
VLIIGGGMAGLTAAWELSRDGWQRTFESITIVERSAHPGGKGASVRSAGGRIHEHGLHVWLGYYDNAFALMRECYEELDRAATDPRCPVQSWRDAFRPSQAIGVAEPAGAGWDHWIATFATNRLLPGERGATGISPAGFVDRSLTLLWDLLVSLDGRAPTTVSALSTSAVAPRRGRDAADLGHAARRLEVAAMAAGSRLASVLTEGSLGAALSAEPILSSMIDQLRGLQREIDRRVADRSDLRRLATIVDLITTAVRGVVADGLLASDRGFGAVDDEDFREWLTRHGARPDTTGSSIVRGMYDLVFAYEEGDSGRPRFAAGQGLELAARFFFDYKGAIFWKMTAGMGDVVIAPLYQALQRRGVNFELNCEVERIELAPDRPRVEAVHLRSETPAGPGELVRMGGMPVFDGSRRPATSPRRRRVMRLGVDVDVVVLAVSIGAIPVIAPDLILRDQRWHDLSTKVRTVATRSAQIWLDESETELGLARDDLTSSGWGPPFDTYASMSHLLPTEQWTGEGGPRGLAYLCGVVPDRDSGGISVDRHLAAYLDDGLARLLPGILDRRGHRRAGVVRHTFTTSATHPSDRYVQALPGSRAARLDADESGVDGLVLAGDWTRTGIDAGCIEAAVISGRRAANTVWGRRVDEDVLGGWTTRKGALR